MAKPKITTIFDTKDELTPALKRQTRSILGFSKTAERSFSGVGRAFGGIVGRVGAIFAGGALIRAGNDALNLASDLNEVQNVVDTSFGAENAKRINEWSATAIKAFGLSELQAKQFNGTLGAMLKSSGLTGDALVEMSTNLSGLAGDFASFYNLDAEEAFAKIRSGISGETEPLKQLGINMSVANLEAFALTQGIKKQWQAMSQAEQVNVRYQYLMKATADAQGDFSKTLETSYANQKRVLQTNLQQVAANALSSVLPLALKFSKYLNDVVSRIGEWINANKNLIATKIEAFFQGVERVVSTLAAMWKSGLIPAILAGVAVFVTLTKAAAAFEAIMVAVKTAQTLAAVAQALFNTTMLASPIGLIIVAVAALIGIIVLLVKNWDTVKEALVKGAQAIGQFFSNVWEGIKTGFIAAFNAIKAVFFTIADIVLTVYGGIAKAVLGLAGKVGKALGFDTSGIDNIIGKIEDVQQTVREGSLIGGVGGGAISRNAGMAGGGTVNENRSTVDINVGGLPRGSNVRQTGNAPGVTLNYGYAGGAH